MENEEKKVGCCENKEKGCCSYGGHSCGSNWRKCRALRVIFWLIIIAIAFHAGSEWGEMKGEYKGEGYRFERGGMMNEGFGRFENRFYNGQQSATGEVTVQVQKEVPAPKQ